MQGSAKDVAQAQIVGAIAEIHEAMLVQMELEVDHALATEPCGQGSATGDAAIRKALLASEDAMVTVLQGLPSIGVAPELAN